MPRYREVNHEQFPELLWFKNNLIHVRTKYGLSQVAFARMTGLSQAYLSALEAGKANPTIEILSVLARTTGVPADKFLCQAKPRVTPRRSWDIDEPADQ